METRSIDSESGRTVSEAGYRFIKEIGNGGYGYIYLLIRDAPGERRDDYVAGKFVYRHIFGPSEDHASGAAYQRALEGLQNFRSLSGESQYLLRIFDVRHRHAEGFFCYMMELADDMESGRRIDPCVYRPRTLKNELERSGRRRRLPATKCADIAMGLARGLQILHQAGFTHRDVRPSNIIFVNDVPKLADIDLLAGHDSALTSYIPKEYAAPEGAHSTQADLYSFGKTLYEMCTGFPVKAFPCLPPDIRYWGDHQAFLRINQIIGRACARDLSKRYSTAENLLNDLASV